MDLSEAVVGPDSTQMEDNRISKMDIDYA